MAEETEKVLSETKPEEMSAEVKPEEMSDESTEVKPEEMSEESAEVKPDDSAQMSSETEPKEDGEGTSEVAQEEDMSNLMYIDVLALEGIMQRETDTFKQIAEEMAKEASQRDFAKVTVGLFDVVKKLASDRDAYMKELSELKAQKMAAEEAQRDFEIDKVLNSVKEDLPKEELKTAAEEGKTFALADIGVWANALRAKAFEFSKTKGSEQVKTKKIGFPFSDDSAKTNSLWG